MKIKTILFSLLILISANAFSQVDNLSDEDLIRHSIHNYFHGTEYNYLAQIDTAFYSGAVLHLENREGELWKMSAAEYIALFEKNTPGEFNNRYSKILSIDIEGNLALVKAEILMPTRNRRYIDVFIMRRMKPGLWQIVSKAANSSLIKKE